MKTIKYSYRDLSQANYIEKVVFICFCLNSNPNFPDLPETIMAIIAIKVLYETELDKSKKGDHVATTNAKTYRSQLDLMLKKNGQYINNTALGDEAMLESSGYDMADERTLKPKPEVKIEATSLPNEVKVFIRKVEGAVAYLVMIAADSIPLPDEEQRWIRQKMTTKTFQLIRNIDALRKYYLRYCSVSPEGETAWSTPIEFIITK
jgi:hypothetical protein